MGQLWRRSASVTCLSRSGSTTKQNRGMRKHSKSAAGLAVVEEREKLSRVQERCCDWKGIHREQKRMLQRLSRFSRKLATTAKQPTFACSWHSCCSTKEKMPRRRPSHGTRLKCLTQRKPTDTLLKRSFRYARHCSLWGESRRRASTSSK